MTTVKPSAALEDLDLLEEIGWFPEQDDAGLKRRFDRIRTALTQADTITAKLDAVKVLIKTLEKYAAIYGDKSLAFEALAKFNSVMGEK